MINTRFFQSIMIWLVLLFAFVPSALANSVSGRIVRDGDSQPLAGIWAVAYDYYSGELAGYALSQADGTYQIAGLISGSYAIFAHTEGTSYAPEFYPDSCLFSDAAEVVVVDGQTGTCQ